jgi:hypothetical protein
MQTYGWADITQLIVALRNLANAPKDQHGPPDTNSGLSLCKIGLKPPEVWYLISGNTFTSFEIIIRLCFCQLIFILCYGINLIEPWNDTLWKTEIKWVLAQGDGGFKILVAAYVLHLNIGDLKISFCKAITLINENIWSIECINTYWIYITLSMMWTDYPGCT